jgi:NADH-quinone oxidoreductase subunit G
LDVTVRELCGLAAKSGGPGIGALVSPSATVEEGYLVARLMSHFGSANIDHRLRRCDFRTQESDPVFPWLGMEIPAVEALEQVLVVGSNLRKEVPLLAHRLRKAALRGAGVHFLNPARYPHLFPVGAYLEGTPAGFWLELGTLVRAAAVDSEVISPAVAAVIERAPAPGDLHHTLVAKLRAADKAAIFIGQISLRHPHLSEIELLASELARLTASSLGYIPEGANAAGLAAAGVLPHRSAAGRPRAAVGASAVQMIASAPSGLILFGIEPEHDCANGDRLLQLATKPDFVLAFSAFMSDSLRDLANVVLPIGTFAESSGTFVNAEGRWQSFRAVATPVGEARPGWKVLRVLGNRLGVKDFDYTSSESVRDELRHITQDMRPDNLAAVRGPVSAASHQSTALSSLDVPIYQVDALVRRARSLQQTEDGLIAAQPAGERLRA